MNAKAKSAADNAKPTVRRRSAELPSAGPWGTQSIHRAVGILREIAAHGTQGLRLFEIADLMRLERPTAHRIVKGLVAQEMLAQDRDTKAYRLGRLVYELGLAASPNYYLREICQPTLKRIAEKTGDSAFLMVRSGFDSVCIDRIEGSYPIMARTLEIGGRRPLGVGAGSLAILMALPDNEIARIIAVNEPRFAGYGHMTAARMRRAIQVSRKAGYAINHEDVLPNVGAIGLALKSHNGSPYIALSIAGISSRFEGPRREELAELLSKEVRALERQVG